MSNEHNQEMIRRKALEPLLRKIKEMPRITLVKHNQGEFIACPCGNMDQKRFIHYKKTIIGEGRFKLACKCLACAQDTDYSNILADKVSLLPAAHGTTWVTGYTPSLNYIFQWVWKIWLKQKLKQLWARNR